jgi:septal ring factor EnvC (AmiA/AmiB activator)
LAAGRGAVEPTLPLRLFRGDLAWPVTGAVRAPFAGGARSGALSNGIEISAPEGASVQAVHEGVVAFAGPFAGLGNLVIIDHGGQNFSLYGNLLRVDVVKGTHVNEGEQVGASGASATAPGLYFELRVDGRPVDPLQWLKKKQP